MTDDEFRELLGRHLEAENAHRLADTLGTLTPDCLFEDVALSRRFGGHEGAAAYYRMWWDGFETEVSPERLHIAGGDVAVAETTWRGVHVGSFLDVPATQRRIEIPVILVVSARDGLMAGELLYWDRATLAGQLNVDINEFSYSQPAGWQELPVQADRAPGYRPWLHIRGWDCIQTWVPVRPLSP